MLVVVQTILPVVETTVMLTETVLHVLQMLFASPTMEDAYLNNPDVTQQAEPAYLVNLMLTVLQ